MALAIATNNAALNAAASASSVNRDMETSMARLSSGKRINSASDDAAGVAISSRLSAEIRGTDQAIRNSLDGQALIDTAEGAHKEIENILQRMREVTIQAANDTNNDQDRANLQAEIEAMTTEIDRIAGTTTWAGADLMEDATTTFSFQVGAATGAKNQISVTIATMNATGLGVGDGTAVSEIDVETSGATANAGTALIDAAIEKVNIQRSELGAVSNRLNHTVNNLTNISSNLSAAKGGIEDADFALETTNLAKNQILQQASTAMLAQANASKQNVLSLLQG
jgi:flagellin